MNQETLNFRLRVRRIHQRRTHQRHTRSAFTLIEVMVALAIFMLLMTIILVPINMGMSVMHIGTARADVQQASQQTLNRIANELRQAVVVFPNDALPGVTDRTPYSNGTVISYPYFQKGTSATVCGAGNLDNARVGNTSRIDFLLPRRTGNVLQTPVTAETYIVSYYARRLNADAAWNATTNPYHPIDNPITLFRAQMPYVQQDTTSGVESTFPNDTTPNALIYNYPSTCGGEATRYNSGLRWLSQNGANEPDLEPVSVDSFDINQPNPQTVPASHQLVTPRDMTLIAPRAGLSNTTDNTMALRNFQPETNFMCEDTNSDGKIDRVTITLVLGQYDRGGTENRDQRVRLTQVVDLPNIR